MKKTLSILLPGLIFILIAPAYVQAQFYRVYGYQTQDADGKELVYWFTMIPSSDRQFNYFGKDVDREGLMAHSVEIEYGLTPRFTVALYADFEHPKNESFRYIMAKAVMAYYRLYEKNMMPVDMAVYVEYKLPRKDFKSSEEIELKIILEKDIGWHSIVLNPTFEKKISGEDVTERIEFVFNGGYYFSKSEKFRPGLEFYTKMGELYDMTPFSSQDNYLFPSFDLFFGKFGQFRWHAGVGVGLTGSADNLIVKSVLSWEFF